MGSGFNEIGSASKNVIQIDLQRIHSHVEEGSQ